MPIDVLCFCSTTPEMHLVYIDLHSVGSDNFMLCFPALYVYTCMHV